VKNLGGGVWVHMRRLTANLHYAVKCRHNKYLKSAGSIRQSTWPRGSSPHPWASSFVTHAAPRWRRRRRRAPPHGPLDSPGGRQAFAFSALNRRSDNVPASFVFPFGAHAEMPAPESLPRRSDVVGIHLPFLNESLKSVQLVPLP